MKRSNITYQRKSYVEIFDFLSDLGAPQYEAYVNDYKMVPVIKVAAIAPFICEIYGSQITRIYEMSAFLLTLLEGLRCSARVSLS